MCFKGCMYRGRQYSHVQSLNVEVSAKCNLFFSLFPVAVNTFNLGSLRLFWFDVRLNEKLCK